MQNKVLERIKSEGFLTVRDYMEASNECYYENETVFGKHGDFITSPEISQVFGELLGMFFITVWHQSGMPKPFRLIELGAGRGTMMCDMLRIAKQVPEFFDALAVHIVEKSSKLKQAQHDAIFKALDEGEEWRVCWHDDVSDIPDGFSCFVGNEFLDALPVTQLVKKAGDWFEKVVRFDGEKLVFDTMPNKAGENITEFLSQRAKDAPDGKTAELNFDSLNIIKEISDHINKNSGVALFIDYGHKNSNYGETLQAMKQHKFVDVLQYAGKADLTAHVDFEALKRQALLQNAKVCEIKNQGELLKGLGIDYRTMKLCENASPEDVKNIKLANQRLVDENQMGELFKAICFYSEGLSTPPAF
jgi:SAM-dependent MidA family methyltransferase